MKANRAWVAIALCLLLLWQSAALADTYRPQASDYYDGQSVDRWAYVNSRKLNYREQPKTLSNNVICSLSSQNNVYVLEKDRDEGGTQWYKVQFYDTVGWVQAKFIILMTNNESAAHALKSTPYGPDTRIGATSKMIPVPKQTTVASKTGITTSKKLNFRRTPQTNSSNVITSLPMNTYVTIKDTVTADGNEWYLIWVDGMTGYVMAKFVRIVDDPVPVPTPVPTQTIQYRALLIVEPTYRESNGQTLLCKRLTDLRGMQNMLSRQRYQIGGGQTAGYSSVVSYNGTTTATVFSEIAKLASQADDDDVTLFFFMGHGSRDGSIHFLNKEYITPTRLRQALDTIPGRVIAIIGSCFSGQYARANNSVNSNADDTISFTDSLISSFSSGQSTVTAPVVDSNGVASNYLTMPKYIVLTAAAYDESSWSVTAYTTSGGSRVVDENNSYSFFVRGVYCAGGWDQIRQANLWSGSRTVTVQQAYNSIASYVASIDQASSTVQVWPSNCDFVLFQQ